MAGKAPIAVNAAIVGQQPTGLGVYALHVIQALHDLGERLEVFTSRPDLVGATGAGVHRVSAGMRAERGARGHLQRLIWVQTGLRRGVRRLRPRPRCLLNLMPEGVLAPSVPQVTTVLDLLPLHYPAEYPRQQYYFRHCVPAVLRHSRAVVAISESTRRDVMRFYDVPADRVHVVLCGYDPARFHPDGPAAPHPSGEPYALYVGNVMPHKNLARLLDAFATVAARRPGRLVICGGGHARHVEPLRARIAALGLTGRVDWRPYVPGDELPALYRGARMLLLPSLYEGFGLTALEALACGTAVVASSTSSIPEVVGDAGLLIDPLDTGAIAGAMTRLFADDRLAKVLAARGPARARRFSWENTGRAVLAVLDVVAAA